MSLHSEATHARAMSRRSTWLDPRELERWVTAARDHTFWSGRDPGPKPEPRRISDAERALWRQIADELESHIAWLESSSPDDDGGSEPGPDDTPLLAL